uniref:Protein kinase domain-containing protein n=1 Tax=Eptatretus burgeri TaxID=7764 RepID=A0A8C4WQG4_EPTBU
EYQYTGPVSTPVAEGMSFMQRKGYIHTDLRASNVLLDDKLNCKISGLHDARQTLGKEFYFREGFPEPLQILPIRWTAVETLKTSLFTSKSDVWSFGIIITELYSYGVLPYIGRNLRLKVRWKEGGLPPRICICFLL